MKKATLTLKRIQSLFKKANFVWQDQQNQHIFYLADRRNFYLKPTPKPKVKGK